MSDTGKRKGRTHAQATAAARSHVAGASAISHVLRRFALGLLLLVAGIAVYANSLDGVFILDDEAHIIQNPRITSISPLATHLKDSRPLVSLSIAFNHALGGLKPGGYHVFNIIVHLLAGLTLFGLARRLVIAWLLRRGRSGNEAEWSAPWIAFTIALVWLIHPLQTQSVTYIIQRAESMMGLFYLLTLYAVVRSNSTSPRQDDARGARRIAWIIIAALAFPCGMLCKAVMVTAPLAALLMDRTFLSGSFTAALRRRWPLYLAFALTLAAFTRTRIVQNVLSTDPSGGNVTVGFRYKAITPAQYLTSQPGVIVHYLELAVWPRRLCLDYAWSPPGSPREIVSPVIAICTLLAISLFALWRRHWLGFAGTAFFLILAPTSSFIPIKDLVFDHRMYLPLAAVVTVLVAGACRLMTIAQQRAGDGSRWPTALRAAVLGAVVVLLGGRTLARNRNYDDAVTMWANVVRQQPTNDRAWYNLANCHRSRGQTVEALQAYRAAMEIKPDEPDLRNNLGGLLVDLDDAASIDEGILHVRTAIRLREKFCEAYNNLGVGLAKKRSFPEAEAAFREAIRIKPDYAEAHCFLGNVLQSTGRLSEAEAEFREALKIRPQYPDACYALGLVLERQQRRAEAIEIYQRTLKMDPRHENAYRRLRGLK